MRDAAQPQLAAGGSPARILVVDDNVDAAELLAGFLQTLGFATKIAHDGPAALHEAEAFRPDIVLLDIGLPVMDGYDVAKRLRSMPGLGGSRIIAVSGYGQPEDRVKSSAVGVFEHLVKPVTMTALRESIERALSSAAGPCN